MFFDLGDTLLRGRGLGAAMDLGYKGAKAAYDRLKAMGVRLPMYLTYMAKVTAAFMAMAGAAEGMKELDLRNELRKFYSGMGAPLNDEQLDAVLAAWHAPFAAEMRLDDGVTPMLDTLRAKGLRLGIITNSVWPAALLRQLLEASGLAGYFQTVVSSADVGFRKPSPAIFDAALKQMDASASESAYVGDRRKEDVVGAQQAGLRCILLKPQNAPDDPGPEPDAVIHSLAELPAALDALR